MGVRWGVRDAERQVYDGARDGGDGTVGRVLIRKLLLRGYTVKALVRRESDVEKLPGLVRVIVGDVGDKETIQTAAAGVNKVIYCASASTPVTSDLFNVDVEGVKNVVSCMQDYYHKLASRRAGRSAKSKVMLTNFKHPTATRRDDERRRGAEARAILMDDGRRGGDAAREFRSVVSGG